MQARLITTRRDPRRTRRRKLKMKEQLALKRRQLTNGFKRVRGLKVSDFGRIVAEAAVKAEWLLAGHMNERQARAFLREQGVDLRNFEIDRTTMWARVSGEDDEGVNFETLAEKEPGAIKVTLIKCGDKIGG